MFRRSSIKKQPHCHRIHARETIMFVKTIWERIFRYASELIYYDLDGSSLAQVEEALEKAAELCLDKGAEDAYLIDTEERKKAVWSARGAFLEAIKASTTEMDECDVVVPRNRIAEFIKYTREVSGETGLRIPSFGHAGDGNLHIYLCRDALSQTEWEQKLKQAFSLLYHNAAALQGLVSGKHVIGFVKRISEKSNGRGTKSS